MTSYPDCPTPDGAAVAPSEESGLCGKYVLLYMLFTSNMLTAGRYALITIMLPI